jgi:hypothetical protein
MSTALAGIAMSAAPVTRVVQSVTIEYVFMIVSLTDM